MRWLLITDTHFGHKGIDRPEGFQEMIIENTSAATRGGDVLIHLGDLSLGDHGYWSERFTSAAAGCKTWLIRGNHDRKSQSWYLAHGWDFVASRIEFRMYARNLVFTHKPIFEQGNYLNIHGHHHITRHHPENRTDSRNRLVYIEHDYRPLSLEKIVQERP